MYARVLTASLQGLDCEKVWAEADIERGMPAFSVVGLVNQSIKESRDRIHSAIMNCGLEFPDKKVTVNLTPAGRKKEGSHFDLPISIAVLIASGQLKLPKDAEKMAFFGELTLDGRIDPVEGALPMVIGMREAGIHRIMLPRANLKEAELIKGTELYPVESLTEACEHLSGKAPIRAIKPDGRASEAYAEQIPDFSDIRGQAAVKRAAQLASAGFHGLLLIGPPGVGKSMVGKRIAGIMPPLSYEQQLECTQIYSIAGMLTERRPLITCRPFRSPHHNTSAVAMVGGGSSPRPGEVSLAHNGVLFLDELPEFSPAVLETLRQPMEDGKVNIVRASGRCTYPAGFMLVAAMNPCRCGYYGDPVKACTCTETERRRYMNRISGPLLDRIDLHVIAQRPAYGDISSPAGPDPVSTQVLREGVDRALCMQAERYKGTDIGCNSRLTPNEINKYCSLDKACTKIMEQAFRQLNLSARSYHRIIKVARSAADVDGAENIREEHLLEALNYRLPEDYLKG